MYSKEILLLSCVVLLLGGSSTTTTTTFVAAMSLANQDLERYFRPANTTHTYASMGEDRMPMDFYNYAFLNWSYIETDNTLVEIDYKEEKARYGEGRVLSVSGRLVHITNVDDISDDFACSPYIRGTQGAPIPKGIQWIALVRRGRCTFEEKVKHVYQQNAVGVIIYNDKQVMQLEKMQIKGKNRVIAAVITYQYIGLDLANTVDKGQNVTIAIIEGRAGVRPVNNLNRTSVLFVSISFIVLMLISLVWLIFYYIQRFRYMQAKDQQSRNLCSVTKKAIMKIPTKTGKLNDEKDSHGDCCAICIETYTEVDIIRILPCKHEFHKNCIDPWLIEHHTCPMCKLDVLRFYGYVVGGADQIYQASSPQHNGQIDPVAPSPHYVVEEVPVIVVSLPPAQIVQQPQASPANISSLSSSNYHQPFSSNSSHSQPQQTRGRRNSAPASVPQGICTASLQFLGSEESILEFEPDQNRHGHTIISSVTPTDANTRAPLSHPTFGNQARTSALSDLIHSRDFVIDPPRIFVVENEDITRDRNTLFTSRVLERSQSSFALCQGQSNKCLPSVTNKLQEQHGLRPLFKDEKQQNALRKVRQRRSYSADDDIYKSCFSRQRNQQSHHQSEVDVEQLTRHSGSSNALLF